MPSRLEGVPNLKAILEQLPKEIERRVIDDALMAGAKIIAARMRASCPVGGSVDGDKHPGFTRSHIRARMASARDVATLAGFSGNARKNFARIVASGQAAVKVALVGASKAAFWARFVEYGWILTTHKPGHRQIKHISAKPFLRPAYEASKVEAQAAIQEKLKIGIEDAAKRLSGSYAGSRFNKRGRFALK